MNRRLGVVHAYPHQVAGAQRLTVRLMKEASDWSPVLFLPDEGPFARYARANGLNVRIVRSGSALRVYGRQRGRALAARRAVALVVFWLRLAREFRRVGVTVVHVNDHRGVLLGALPARALRLPVVWHAHGPHPDRRLNRVCARVSTAIVAVSGATLDALRLSRRCTIRKCTVVHNTLPDVVGATWAGDGSRRHSDGGKGFEVATGARLHPDKGIDTLIRAIAVLRSRGVPVSLSIAGHVQTGYEDYAASLEALARSLEVADSVRFLGYVAEPEQLWAAADVYVQSSRAEPFGLCLLEAMAAGTPVVATAVDGMVEVIDDGVTGILVTPEDPDALATAIGELLAHPRRGEQLTLAARRSLDTQFSVETFRQRFHAVYARVTGAGAPRIVRVGNAVTLWTVQARQLVEMRNRGAELILVTDDDEWSRRLARLGLPCVAVPLDRRPGVRALIVYGIRFVGLVAGLHDTIVHSHNTAHMVVVRAATPFMRRCLIVETVHNLYELDQPGRPASVTRRFLRMTAGTPSLVLTITASYAARVAADGMAPAGALVTVGSGVDVSRVRERYDAARSGRDDRRGSLGIPDSAWVSIVVARLDPQKGHDVYLQAAAVLRSEHAELYHLFVGHGMAADRIAQRADELGLHDRTRFLGFRDDVPELLGTADLLVLPSEHEGFGRCLVEGMACGLPCVATRSGGPDELLGGGAGVLVDFEPGALAQGIDQVLRDPGLRDRLRTSGPTRASRYAEPPIAAEVLRLYQETWSER